MLVAAMNHCPCGRYPDLKRCTCTDRDISRYAGKISGPILDRIDICAEAACMTYQEISGGKAGQSSAELMKRVEKAFLAQQDRYQRLKVCYNSELSGKQVEKYCSVSREGDVYKRQDHHGKPGRVHGSPVQDGSQHSQESDDQAQRYDHFQFQPHSG